MNWENYVLTRGEESFTKFWSELEASGVLVVIGNGFDPRIPRIVRVLGSAIGENAHVLRLDVDGGESVEENMREFAAINRAQVDGIVEEFSGTITEQAFPDVSAQRSAGLLISREFQDGGYLERFSHIVIDISGLPRSVFFPLIRGVLQRSNEGWAGNLHVVAIDSSEVDSSIIEEGAESPNPLGGFAGPPDGTDWAATIWVPVLGEGIGQQLDSLLASIDPDEVVPVLPFPAANPRRGDDIILEHHQILNSVLTVEPRNYLHASESNPFDLYRGISNLYDRYQDSLAPLGMAEFVLSTHSSKLLSIGVLLAAFELSIRVMHVSPSRYQMVDGVDFEVLGKLGSLTDLWLTGDPYRE